MKHLLQPRRGCKLSLDIHGSHGCCSLVSPPLHQFKSGLILRPPTKCTQQQLLLKLKIYRKRIIQISTPMQWKPVTIQYNLSYQISIFFTGKNVHDRKFEDLAMLSVMSCFQIKLQRKSEVTHNKRSEPGKRACRRRIRRGQILINSHVCLV